MRYILASFIFISSFVFGAAAQNDAARERKIREIQTLGGTVKELRAQIEKAAARQVELQEEILAATDADIAEAARENVYAFRIYPRGSLDNKISIRGGAAYYSFTNRSHDYNRTPQIQLDGGDLSVGFYGASYGFIADLGETPLGEINGEVGAANFLIDYKAPTVLSEARIEQNRARNFEENGTVYKNRFPAAVGHSYVLRAVSFGEADALVAFKVYRRDADGSLIIFWKNIRNFETPKLEKIKLIDAETIVKKTDDKKTDDETANAVRNALIERGIPNVSVEAAGNEVLVHGFVPKGKMAEAVRITHEIAKRKILNQLTEQ